MCCEATTGSPERVSAIAQRGVAHVIVATGASQLETLEALRARSDIEWHKIHFFHMDEYVGLSITHPASFRKYLWERFHSRLPTPPLSFCYVSGEGDPDAECRRAGDEIRRHSIDVCFAGIGENGHLAFNDPPADFETEEPYLMVNLDEACRRQQMGEGWFTALDEVPQQAISISVRQIMKSAHVVIACPDTRKAAAVRRSVEGPVTPEAPASILQRHPSCHLFLDKASAAELSG